MIKIVFLNKFHEQFLKIMTHIYSLLHKQRAVYCIIIIDLCEGDYVDDDFDVFPQQVNRR